MKKKLLFLGGILAISPMFFGQTWTAANEPAVGASQTMYLVDTAITVNIYSNLTGASQTWDFSQLAGYAFNDREVIVTDGDVLNDVFPDADFVQFIPDFMNIAYSYEGFAGAKMAHGYQLEVPDFGIATFTFTDYQQMLQFPMALGTTFTDDLEGSLNLLDNDNPAEGSTWVTCDGSGTLLLANDVTHEDVLRIHTIDSIYADIDITEPFPITTAVTVIRNQYDYVKTGGTGLPLFTVVTIDIITGFGAVPGVRLLLSSENPSEHVAIDNLDFSAIQVFPNPSDGLLNVNLPKFDGQAQLNVLDAAGREVYAAKVFSGTTHLDLSFVDAGLYFVQVVMNGEVSTQKVLIK
jgi:hypothetical protein